MRTPILTFVSLAVALASATAQDRASVARLVIWQPKPGMVRDFEDGYSRHLQWHRAAHDPWSWHGWTFISGERVGFFMDGSFGHAWADLDSPVSPAADSADNVANVFPYADVRAAATYELVGTSSDFDASQLASPLMTVGFIAIRPGAAEAFESRVAAALGSQAGPAHAVLRPVDGATEYLLLVPAAAPSQLGRSSAFMQRVLTAIASDDSRLVERFRTETARYRSDLSYRPER